MSKVLFVCSRNKRRSLTAEKIFKKSDVYQARSAGTENGSRAKITEGLINWADIIYVMEKKHRARILEKYPRTNSKKIVVLHIPDDFEFMDEELIATLQGVLPDA